MTRYGRNCATYEEGNVQRVGGGGRRDGQREGHPEKNAMHVQGMLLAFLGMSTWYLHETCMCHACFMHSVQHAYDHYACFWPPCMLHSQTCKKLA